MPGLSPVLRWHANLAPEIIDLLNCLPLEYTIHLYILFDKLLQHSFSSQFSSRLVSSLTSIRTTLPPALTARLAENPVQSQDFTTMFPEVKDMITMLLGILVTTITMFVPSQILSNACFNVLTALNTGLYADQSADLFALHDSLFIALTSITFAAPPAVPYSSAVTNFPSELFSLINNTLPSDRCDLPDEIDLNLIMLTCGITVHVTRVLSEMNDGRMRAAVDCHLEDVSLLYVYQTPENAGSDSDNCSVCLEDLKDGDYARRLRCLHHFHLQCIDRCLRTKRNCPLCRTPVDANQD